MIRSRPLRMALVAAQLVAPAACEDSPRRDWVRVAADANYDIALDRLHVMESQAAPVGGWDQAFEVWYRTDHAQPRAYNGETFDREIVRAILLCDRYWFRVVSVDMSMGDGKVVARQQASEKELDRQPWRPVERGTIEEDAAVAACDFGRQAASQVADATRRPQDERSR
jgi:hypothetical protein